MINVINAKVKFTEGFIMILRPFQFAEMKNPIQKMTIVWAYAEQPVLKKYITSKAKKQVELIENSSYVGRFFTQKEKEEFIEQEIEKVYKDRSSWENVYKGEIVQCQIDGQTVRFYPDEYNIISKDKLQEILEEDGYHAVCSKGLFELKEFRDKQHYLMSRGVSRNVANKWASVSYKELVYYKPYYELLKIFCREHQIYPDKFYEEVEGIRMEEQKNKE